MQAKLRINTVLIAPNVDDPDVVDGASITGWIGFCRLRPDASWLMFRQAAFYGENVKSQPSLGANRPRDRLPMPIENHELGIDPPIIETPWDAAYVDLIRRVSSSLGWNLSDVRGDRCTVEYPPFPSTVMVAIPLEVAPQDESNE